EQGTLAGLKACLRCHCHASIKALEKALESSPEVAALLADWIHAYSSNDGANPGGFARAVRNSDKLREQFSEFQKLDEASASLGAMSYAPQRFGTLMQVATCIVKNIRPIFDMLAELKVGKTKLSGWAGKLLKNCFRADRLILFALISEFSETATKYSRAFDNVKEQGRCVSNIARTAHLIDSLEARLRQLFSFRDKEGALQKPLVLQDGYNGHLQRVKETWNFFHSRKLLVQGEMFFYSAGLGTEEVAVWVAGQLGVLQNILNLYIQGVRAEYDDLLASALSPFDVHHWRTRSDASLLAPEIMHAVASILPESTGSKYGTVGLRLQAAVLKEQYLAARSGVLNLDDVWRDVMAHWGDKLPELGRAASFLLCTFGASTSSIEQQFSFLQLFTEGRKHGTSLPHLRALMKSRLDGGEVVVAEHRQNGGYVLVPSEMAHRIQRQYRVMFGEKGNVQRTQLELPRRAVAKKKKPESTEPSTSVAANDPETLALEQVAAAASTASRSERQKTLQAELERYAARKRKLLAEDALRPGEGPAAKKLRDHTRRARLTSERLQQHQVQKLASIVDKEGPPAHETVVVLRKASEDIQVTLAALGARCVLWGECVSPDLIEAATQVMRSKHVIWLASDAAEEMEAVKGRLCTFAVGMRLIGGAVAGPEWWKASKARKRLLPAFVELAGHLWTGALEVHVHKSVVHTADEAMLGGTLSACLKGAAAVGRMTRWVTHKKWKNVRQKTAYIIMSEAQIKEEKKRIHRPRGELASAA
ncbi:ygeX, partial [Symbiodinium sp. CCMP2456]